MTNHVTPLGQRYPRVVFVRVGWMKFYGAAQGHDELLGGGSFNNDDVGNEHANFAVQPSGLCEGWFQPPGGGGGFTLRRIDPRAEADASFVDDVLVVMVATHPVQRGQRVVGWYRHAQCWWSYYEDDNRWHQFSAAPANCVLVPAALRSAGPIVPRGKGSMGQANVYYTYDKAGRAQTAPWIDKVLAYVDTYGGPNVLTMASPEDDTQRAAATAGEESDSQLGGQGHASSVAAKRAVEQHAIATASAHYAAEGWTVESTEANRTAEFLDLRCTKGDEVRTVEVKGTVGGSDMVWLTHNEVVHAREHAGTVALVMVHGIIVEESDAGAVASGGTKLVLDPWDISEGVLQPLAYRYLLPQ